MCSNYGFIILWIYRFWGSIHSCEVLQQYYYNQSHHTWSIPLKYLCYSRMNLRINCLSRLLLLLLVPSFIFILFYGALLWRIGSILFWQAALIRHAAAYLLHSSLGGIWASSTWLPLHSSMPLFLVFLLCQHFVLPKRLRIRTKRGEIIDKWFHVRL